MIVVGTKPGSDGKGYVKLRLDDGSEVEAWTPELDKVLALGDKPVPDGWTLKDNKQGTGKVFLPPRQGGGAPAAYRNTREGFDREAASRAAWQQVEEERKDRRTALMQAVIALGPNYDWANFRGGFVPVAEFFYEWLRSSPGVEPKEPAADSVVRPTPGGISSPTGLTASGAGPSPAGGTTSGGEGPQARAGSRSGPPPDTQSAGPSRPTGTADAPGEARPSPGAPLFPRDPAACNHKMSNGHWVKWREIPLQTAIGETSQYVCPKCGTPKIVAMEGTNADLGAA